MICPAQTSSLVQVQFIAQITQVASPLLGEIADRYGAPTVAYLMAMSVWLGLSLLIVSAYQRIDGLLYVSFVSTAFGTWTGGLLTVQTGMYFLDRTRSRVIFSLNSMFDAGSITSLPWQQATIHDSPNMITERTQQQNAVATTNKSAAQHSSSKPTTNQSK